MAVAVMRRLPGIGFEARAPQPQEVLPRMDVAVFTGFASSGPLHLPVAIEDVASFEEIFGPDAPLAWDQERGEQIFAYLGPAVRAFFRNGGRRCWVIRVADKWSAEANLFPIPGLARAVISDDGKVEEITPAFGSARSQGSWSDTLRVSASLLREPTDILQVSLTTSASGKVPALDVFLAALSSNDINRGDLLRLTFRDCGYVLLTPVQSVEKVNPDKDGSPPFVAALGGRTMHVTGGPSLWFRLSRPPEVPSPIAAVKISMMGADSSISTYEGSVKQEDQTMTLVFDCPLSLSPEPGTMLLVEDGSSKLWFTVEELHAAAQQQGESPPGEAVEMTGSGMWVMDPSPQGLPDEVPVCEVLTFELWVSDQDTPTLNLTDLAFDRSHRFFWGGLPTDTQLYEGGLHTPISSRPPLWDAAARPRFPLAGSIWDRHISFEDAKGWEISDAGGKAVKREIYFPVGMEYLPALFCNPLKSKKRALERDGLSEFKESLFLDPDMLDSRVADLISDADYLRYQSVNPRSLCGIHAALGVEEPTILAIPDAVHRRWSFTGFGARDSEAASPPDGSQVPAVPEGGGFVGCSADLPVPSLHFVWATAQSEEFIISWTKSPEVGATYIVDEAIDPNFTIVSASYPLSENWISFSGKNAGSYYYRVRARIGSDSIEWQKGVKFQIAPPGTVTLCWSGTSESGTSFVVEESDSLDFVDFSVVYSGPDHQITVYGMSVGEHYYRVHMQVGADASKWSEPVILKVAASSPWTIERADAFSEDALVSIHRAALRLCAARSDMLAVLALPSHYRETDSIKHVSTLRSTTRPNGYTGSVEPLGYGEVAAFSYGALYHPWIIGGDEGSTSATTIVPPDGAACGVLAMRSILRGAWVAPANEPLRGVVSLAPTVGDAWHLRIQCEQINLVRQVPQGFVCLNADTLSPDEDLRQINVRRLLILIRRFALLHGVSYVFEPNDEAFQRRVKRGFEAMLESLYERGAFQGATPEAAYQVVTDSNVNTPQSIEQGLFIVELRVAPSLPMRFLTIRLVQSGDRTLVATEE